MTERFEIRGASGEAYIYRHLPEGAPPPFQGANLIVAERSRGRWRLLHVADTDYMPRDDWRAILHRVRKQAPRAELFYRLNISHKVRRAEAEDIRGHCEESDDDAIAA